MTQLYDEDTAIGATPIIVEEKASFEIFKAGDFVKVTGVTKGKGFQGVVKRHGFHGGPKSHGQKDRLRAPGSIGSTAMQRVVPGKKMAGRMGGNKRSIKNIKVVAIDVEKQIIFLRGAVPGNAQTRVFVTKNI